MSNTELQAAVNDYLELDKLSDEVTEKMSAIRDMLFQSLIAPGGSETTWEFEGATITKISPRKSEKTDVKLAKKNLVLAGVAISVVEDAFERATTRSVAAAPTMQIRRK